MKFEIGDKVKVIHSGSGFAGNCIDNVYTLIDADKVGYFGTEGYVTDGININKGHNGWVGVKSFELVEEADVPKNSNVKIINTFVPSWAKWMAMDNLGNWIVFNIEPVPYIDKGKWIGRGPKLLSCKVGMCDPKDISADWKETLHEI